MDSYGWVLYKLGDVQGARQWLTRASRPTFSSADDYLKAVLTNPAAVRTGESGRRA